MDYRLPFVMLFACSVVAFLLVRSIPGEDAHFAPPTEELLELRADHDRGAAVYLYAAWWGVFMACVLAAVTRSVFPKQVADLVATGELRLLFESEPAAILTEGTATKFSWLSFSLSIATVACFLIMGKTSRWQHKFQLLFWLQVGAAASFWVLSHTRSLVIMVACFLVVGVNFGVAFFSGVYYSMGDPRHKHRRAALNEGAVGVGSLAGSIVYGYLAEHFGLALPFRYTPFFIAAALAVQVGLLRYGKAKSSRVQPPTTHRPVESPPEAPSLESP
jgi:MFS family permease